MSLEERLYSSAIDDLSTGLEFGDDRTDGAAAGSWSAWRSAAANRRAHDGTLAHYTRLFDIIFALVVLIAAAPALLLLILVLKCDSPGPILFVQQRVGRNGQFFPCFKLRTMVVDASARLEALLKSSPEACAEWERDHKLRQDPRVTAFGRFVRKFSLDELPQLLNILLGHMSVVGPRPIVEAEIWRYGSHFADYCSVRPGLTGLWQVSGRNHTSYDERVALDRYYVRNKSLALDFAIIVRSVPVVLGARGAY